MPTQGCDADLTVEIQPQCRRQPTARFRRRLGMDGRFDGKTGRKWETGIGDSYLAPCREWRDRADLSVFFFRFHSGGLDWNCEGSVKGGRREPRQRACPLTGSSQFRFRSCGSERKCRMRGMWFARLIVPLGWCSGLVFYQVTLRSSLPSHVKLPSILLVKIRSPNLCPYPYSYPDPFLPAVTWQPPDVALMHLKAPV